MRDASLNPTFSVSRLAVHLTLWGACALYLVPLLVMLLTSFKTPDDIRTGNLLSLPDTFTVIGWLKAWDSVGAFFWNSVLITVPGVLISTFIGALNGYVLSMALPRFPAVLRRAVVRLLPAVPGDPPADVLHPRQARPGQYHQWPGAGPRDLRPGLHHAVLPQLFRGDPGCPGQAARLDGAGFFTIFLRILLPMSTPIVMVCLIWQFTQIWNDFLFGVVFASGDSQPITVALNNLVNITTGVKEYNVDMAAAMIAALPTLVVYVLAGKYFVRGLTAGAVKAETGR